ncbi:MAG: uridylate kinase [Hyphomicrobium sp.]|nr:uridylate kinase [Hyphomicrobium sp.]
MPATLLVLKLGGSLLESGRLTAVLDIVAKRKRPVIVVPGGGRFADQVRDAQAANGFDDASAHRLALFAMHQMANVIASRSRHFAPAATKEEIGMAGVNGLVPVWLPSTMAGADPTIPKSWDMTSDSLAAWLAGEVGAKDVALVKSCTVDPAATLDDVTATGIIDPLFRDYVKKLNLSWSVIGEGDGAALARLVAASSEQD